MRHNLKLHTELGMKAFSSPLKWNFESFAAQVQRKMLCKRSNLPKRTTNGPEQAGKGWCRHWPCYQRPSWVTPTAQDSRRVTSYCEMGTKVAVSEKCHKTYVRAQGQLRPYNLFLGGWGRRLSVLKKWYFLCSQKPSGASFGTAGCSVTVWLLAVLEELEGARARCCPAAHGVPLSLPGCADLAPLPFGN